MADMVAAAYAYLPAPPGHGHLAAWKAEMGGVEEGLRLSDRQEKAGAADVEAADMAPTMLKLVVCSGGGYEDAGEAADGQPAAAWHTQVALLTLRMMRDWWRNPNMMTAGEGLVLR